MAEAVGLVARLDDMAMMRQAIEQALSALSAQIVGASGVLQAVKAGLQDVKSALGSSVGAVSIAPVPGRTEELARAVDVLVSHPTGSALPVRLQGLGARSLAAVMVFQAFVQRRLPSGTGLSPLVLTAFVGARRRLTISAR